MAVEKNKVYPSRTRRMKIQGSVQVEIAIDAAGNITAARMVRSSGEASLDEAALDTARKPLIRPAASRFGRIIVMQIDFQLNKR
jgi:protein TonB